MAIYTCIQQFVYRYDMGKIDMWHVERSALFGYVSGFLGKGLLDALCE